MYKERYTTRSIVTRRMHVLVVHNLNSTCYLFLHRMRYTYQERYPVTSYITVHAQQTLSLWAFR